MILNHIWPFISKLASNSSFPQVFHLIFLKNIFGIQTILQKKKKKKKKTEKRWKSLGLVSTVDKVEKMSLNPISFPVWFLPCIITEKHNILLLMMA